MATSFDRWEKDPFFCAAEEVQESADRMGSLYRTWIHANKDNSNLWNSVELQRDLQTALGTAKWQLEEFVRAVKLNHVKRSSDDSSRHREFIIAIEDQISKIEQSIKDSALAEGKATLPWVRLDEGECNELALFLSGPTISNSKNDVNISLINNDIQKRSAPDSASGCAVEAREDQPRGHRRTASASADISSWKIAIHDDINNDQHSSSIEQPTLPPRKVPSFSGFLNTMESAAKLKWPKNGFRKWKAVDRFAEADTSLLRSSQLTRGIDACYERSKSCLDTSNDCYDKQLYGWYGVIQRQLQRSQYQMQYSRPVQVTLWIVFVLCLIALVAVCVV